MPSPQLTDQTVTGEEVLSPTTCIQSTYAQQENRQKMFFSTSNLSTQLADHSVPQNDDVLPTTWHGNEGCKPIKHDNYVMHWREFQEKYIIVYDCSMIGCTIQSAEESRILKHQMICHKQLDKNNTLSSHVEPNMFYRASGDATFRKFVRVNIAAREAARKERKQYIIDHSVDFHVQPNNSLAVSRGQYADFDFNNNSAKVITR
ncbi:unnamed protein product [Mytilus coruscus]|uniref:Uncharacterized protein n=1 Tax=Mytilus coruscus TaxID=42192 RepID=A0A6J8EPQ9_MYTCO|nr:unnamed protein product [Mytilus coruscus]